MSKGIIVLNNIPENCVSCRLSILSAYGGKFCKVVKEYTYTDKPDWCPIKPVPDRACHEEYWDNGRYDKGWNECLEAILKGGKDNA